MALRPKMRSEPGSPRTGLRPWGGDEAEGEDFGDSKARTTMKYEHIFVATPGPPSRVFAERVEVEGTGPILPISSSLVASRHPVCVAPRSSTWTKLAPVAAIPGRVNRPCHNLHSEPSRPMLLPHRDSRFPREVREGRSPTTSLTNDPLCRPYRRCGIVQYNMSRTQVSPVTDELLLNG
jgi:hypothetical protein